MFGVQRGLPQKLVFVEQGFQAHAQYLGAAALVISAGVVVRETVARSLTSAVPSVYDVYVAIPLRIERTLKKRSDGEMDVEPPMAVSMAERDVADSGVAR